MKAVGMEFQMWISYIALWLFSYIYSEGNNSILFNGYGP